MNNTKPKFTIIATAYNIGNYISDFISSVKAQSFTDFECIIVDDDSTDATYSVAKESISGDAKFTLISIPHGGPQNAKEKGFRYARGENVIFVDGDDTLHPDCLLKCAQNLSNVDLLIFGINFQDFFDGKLISENKIALNELEFESGEELADWYINNHKLLLYSNANKCYKAGVIKHHNIRYRKELYFGEDRLFNFDFIKVSKKIKTIPDVLYNYRRINQNSITSRFRSHHIEELLFLHQAKMDCMLELSKLRSKDEKEMYRKYDLQKIVCQAFIHIAEHLSEMTDSKAKEEISYLSSFEMPDVFYEGNEHISLVEYINQYIFPKNNDFDFNETTVVIVLGSKKCKYRIKAAFEKFGNRKYICCGGNVSDYTDIDGHFLTESNFMSDFLKNKNVKNILIENNSKNTNENIKNVLKIIDSNENPVIVTGAFHEIRTQHILNSMGIDWKIFPVYGPNTRPDNWYKNKAGINAIITEFEKMIEY